MQTTLREFRVVNEPCPDGYDWHVVDQDGDYIASCRSERQALADARKARREAGEEFREDRLADLQRQASELADSCEDEWVLEQVVRLLSKGA